MAGRKIATKLWKKLNVSSMDSKLEQKLNQFRQKFVDEYKAELATLINLWKVARTEKSTTSIEDFTFAVHKLKGSSGALNFLNLTDRLNIIENELLGSKKDTSLFTIQLISYIDKHMNALIAGSKQSPDPMLLVVQKESEASAISNAENTESTIESRNLVDLPSKSDYSDIKIALIDDDMAVSALMLKLLTGFGFVVKHFVSIESYEQQQDVEKFDLILLDLVMPKTTQDQVFEFAQVQQKANVVVFVLSSLNTFESRLAGIRAGVSDYLLKPINVTTLVSKIRKTFKIDVTKPHKILLLDDQAAVGHFYKVLLEDKGVEVHALTDPNKLMETLESFYPDVFLLDMHMPDVSGIEVAKLLRQQSKYDYVPIVFLTADTELKTKLLALECGADDVIPKDTSASMIISQLESRIKRGQEIRYLASRDSLTGVLNHGQIMEAAGQAFRLSQRNKTKVTVAMIDIDYFKKVNDVHGHSGGDKVLVSLGQLLLQSVRETDYVGRYGGEEFMVVLNGSDENAIEKKLNDIREAFNQITFKVNKQTFRCSFSAGIATSVHYEKLNEIVAAADKALYLAKDKGRNKVCVDGDI
ncbi:MAG: diguanylate cyclase [Aliiglaciecola sp.]